MTVPWSAQTGRLARYGSAATRTEAWRSLGSERSRQCSPSRQSRTVRETFTILETLGCDGSRPLTSRDKYKQRLVLACSSDAPLEEPMSADAARDLDLALRALADPNRRALLAAVRDSPRSVGELAETVGLSQQATSHHLRVLHAAGLASGTREGTRHLFAIDTDGLAAVRSYLDGFWPARLAALKSAVESDSAGTHGSDGE